MFWACLRKIGKLKLLNNSAGNTVCWTVIIAVAIFVKKKSVSL